MVHLDRGLLHRRLLCAGPVARRCTAEPWHRGRGAGIHPVFVVLDDVRGGHRGRHADLGRGRAGVASGQQPRDDHGHHHRGRGRQRGDGLQMVVPALGVQRLGLLRDLRPVAGLFQLSSRPAADDPVRPDAPVRSAPVRTAGPCRRCRGRRGNHPGRRADAGFRRGSAGGRSDPDRHRRPCRCRGYGDDDGHRHRAGGDHGVVDPVGTVRRRQGHQVAVQPEHGAVLHPAWVLHRLRGHVVRVQRVLRRALALCDQPAADEP